MHAPHALPLTARMHCRWRQAPPDAKLAGCPASTSGASQRGLVMVALLATMEPSSSRILLQGGGSEKADMRIWQWRHAA